MSPVAARLVLAAALSTTTLGANALVFCTDGWGQSYALAQRPAPGGELQCAGVDEPAAAALPAPEAPTAPAGLISVSPPRRASGVRPAGGLRLAPPAGPGFALASRFAGSASGVLQQTLFDAMIAQAARDSGQEVELLRAIVHVESRFNPNAVSPKGAIGLMQVMPATASMLGLADPRRALFEPASNLRVGAQYLRQLRDQFAGRTDLAIAAYNAGPAAVSRRGNVVPPFAETRKYVHDVLDAWRLARDRH